MFAPLLAKPNPKTKSVEPQHATVAAQRASQSAVHQLQTGVTGRAAVPSWDFSNIPIFFSGRERLHITPRVPAPCLPGPIQAKLKVGAVDDPLEHEADRIADQVVRMPAPTSAPPQVSGKCDACEEEAEKPQERAGPQVTAGEAPAIVHEGLHSPGQPLDAATRAYFEPRFGYDFSHVRVHTDGLAERSADAVAAEAYTVGSHVVFGSGRYTLASSDGRRLLAHELAHVVRQSTHEVIARQPTKPSVKSKTVFHPGVMHDHKPSGRWADVQKDPKSGPVIETFCKHNGPRWVMRWARDLYLSIGGSPIGKDHLDHFLNGSGKDFVEDGNLELMLRTDAGVQDKIRRNLPGGKSSGTFAGHLNITQDDYSSGDFRNAFGEIDRLDFEVDFAADKMRAWFQDRYEWHPVYPFYDQQSGDYERPTNCVHAAGVELKADGAKDYWMKGEIPFMNIPLAESIKDPGPPTTAL
jgi:hypothetical protein